MDIGIFGESQLHQGYAFLLTENHANSGMLIRHLHIAVKIVDIHLHLAKVLMGEPTNFQIDQDIATQQAVVENEVNEETVVVKGLVVRACLWCPSMELVGVHYLLSSSQFLQQLVAKFGIDGGISETACFTFARSGQYLLSLIVASIALALPIRL